MVRPGYGLLFSHATVPGELTPRECQRSGTDHHDPTGPRKNASPIAARTTPLASPNRTSHALARVSSITADLSRDATSPTATRTPAIPIPKASTTITPVPSRPSAAERTTRPTASQQGTSPPAIPRPIRLASERAGLDVCSMQVSPRVPQISADPPEPTGRDREPRDLDQALMKRRDAAGTRPPEDCGDQKNAPGVAQSREQAKQGGLVPAGLRPESDRRNEGFAVAWLDRMDRAQACRNQHQAQPGAGGAAIEQARKLAGARKDIRTACLAGLDRDRVVFSLAPRITQRWAAKGDFDLFGSSFLQVGQLPDGANRDVGDIRGQIVAFDHNAIATPDRQSAGPFARDVVGVVNLQAASIGQHRLKMEREARVLFHGDLETPHLSGTGLPSQATRNPLASSGPVTSP